MLPPVAVPRFRLGLFYFLFFAAVGALLPYWPLYLESLKFSASEIGLTLGLMMATRIVTPNLWAWLGDRGVSRILLIRAGSIGALLVFSVIPGLESFRAVALAGVLYSLFWSAVLPQFEVITLNHLRAGSGGYSRIRLWGSVGFVLASALIGAILEHQGAASLPWLMMGLIGLLIAAAGFIHEAPAAVATSGTGGLLVVLRDPRVQALLLACFLMQVSHGPYYVFFSIQLQSLGYGSASIGALWALAVIAEVLLFAAMPGILRRYPARDLFVGCFLLTALRWVLMAVDAANPAVLIVAQCLHAVSFGAYHAIAIQLIHRQFTGPRQGRGQALYASLSFGAGGAVGSIASGWIWDPGNAWLSWSLAAVTATVGALVAWRGLERD